MVMALLDALALVWIMAREKEDPEDGEERTLPTAAQEEGRRAVEDAGPYGRKEAVA